RRAVDLPGHFRVVLFWPDDLGLVKAGPELRRRFLNQMLVQVERGYARSLAGLRRVLEQRNSLLKRMAAGEGGEDMLDAWNQQRTAVVSLKLAEAALIERRTGERAVLLLDDVLSELDGERRAALLREVGGGGQVIITSVEAGPFPPELLAKAMVWNVEAGRIQACG